MYMIQEKWSSIETFINQELEKTNPFIIFSGEFSRIFSLGTKFLDDLIKIAIENNAKFTIKPTATSNEYPEDNHENYFDIIFTKIS